MLSRSRMPFAAACVVLIVLSAGNLHPDLSDVPRGPFPLVLLDERMEVGPTGGSHPGSGLTPTSDYAGALNFRINQDETEELQNEQQIVTNPLDPDNLVAVWRDFRLGYRRVGVASSFDGGFTWA